MGTAQGADRRDAGRRRPVSLISAALLAFGAAMAFVTGTPLAAADPVGDCTATRGAVVAVDFGPFGGTVERGCDTTPTTGYELLHEGGFTTEGTEHDGPAFICRIGSGSFNSGTRYPTPDKDDCVPTPQATAYWSYWIASPGQDEWSYSPLGAMDREPEAGDVDAWVFGGTDVGGTTGRPSFTPDEVRAGGGGPSEPSGPPTLPAGEVDIPAAARWLTSTAHGRRAGRRRGRRQSEPPPDDRGRLRPRGVRRRERPSRQGHGVPHGQYRRLRLSRRRGRPARRDRRRPAGPARRDHRRRPACLRGP